jgi:hypothetical protein
MRGMRTAKRIVAVNASMHHSFSPAEAARAYKRLASAIIELTAAAGWTEHVFPAMPSRGL